MNTKQKLTLGIAAIFMVTLTIVGITYAYFVTRVTTNSEATVDVQTASVGEVEYVPGNGTDDLITLSDVLPGSVKYKTFSVTNNGAAGANAIYSIFYTATPDTTGTPVDENTVYAPQFVHSTNNAGTGCFNTADVKQSNQTGYTESCFAGTSYDNIYYTLYEVTQEQYALFTNANVGELPDGLTLPTATVAETRVNAISGVETSSANATATGDVKTNITINGAATHYYVLKVEYKDNGMNQNIENEAELSIKVNIR